jgi:hypothetical protein
MKKMLLMGLILMNITMATQARVCDRNDSRCLDEETAKKAAESHDPELCLKASMPPTCFIGYARLTKDSSACERISDPQSSSSEEIYKNNCYQVLAQTTLDPRFCGGMPKPRVGSRNFAQEMCFQQTYAALAHRDKDPKMCAHIGPYDAGSGNMAFCYSQLAVQTHQPNLCHGLSLLDRNRCIANYAILMRDCSILEKEGPTPPSGYTVKSCEDAVVRQQETAQRDERSRQESREGPVAIAAPDKKADRMMRELAGAVEKGDLERANQYVSPKDRTFLLNLDAAGRARLAKSVRRARLIKADSGLRIYKVPFEINGETTWSEMTISMISGQWQVSGW